jgi:hypothetical protein
MDTRQAAQRWAQVWERGWREDLAGVSLLRFGPDGLVVEHRDFWNSR